ncbi:MAG: PilZ domain-containing protein [Nitrospirota bacterium]
MDMENERYIQMREFSRVDARIPFEVRLLPLEERKDIRAKMSGASVLAETKALPDLPDKLLGDWMRMLNAKLDAVINILTFQREGFGSLPFAQVNISGAGIGFGSREKYHQGDVLEMKLILPVMPPVALYLYGEVVKIEKRPENYYTGTKFIAIDEEVRDQIVKFVFKRQREILRDRRG